MKIEVDLLSSFYRELYDEMGEKVMLNLYEMYRGLTISVPQKLYDSKKVKKHLEVNYEKETLSKEEMKDIMKQFGYSERHVYRMLRK